MAQSIAGGGGLVTTGNSVVMEPATGGSGSFGLVTVNVNATISATGAGASGVITQSKGDPMIVVVSGVSVTGGAGGTAITSDGPETHITNHGTLSTTEGADGLAIKVSSGYADIVTGGTILGNFDLEAGAANRVQNLEGGVILAGRALDLGGTGVLVNAGTLRSGTSSLGTTTIDGNLVQTKTGLLVLRADPLSTRSGGLTITGSASLSGKVEGVISDPSGITAGSFEHTILTARGG